MGSVETAACCFAHSLIMVTLARVSGQWIRMSALSDLCMLVTYPATYSNSKYTVRKATTVPCNTQQQYPVRKARTLTCSKADTKCNSTLQHSDGIVKRTSTIANNTVTQPPNHWFRGWPNLCTSFTVFTCLSAYLTKEPVVCKLIFEC